jgi:hypothetical protein
MPVLLTNAKFRVYGQGQGATDLVILTWDGPGGKRSYERELIEEYQNGTGNVAYDLATPEDGQQVTLKELFKAIEKAGLQYQTIHYCPCRVVSDKSGKDVYDPNLQRKIDSGEVKFQ